MAHRDLNTLDLFDQKAPLLSMRHVNVPRGLSFGGHLKRSISLALKESDLSREEVAAKMGVELDDPGFSKGALDTLTAESKEDHQISVVRFVALIKVTGASWLMGIPAREVGLDVHLDEDALFIEIAKIDKEMQGLAAKKKSLAKHLAKNRKKP